MKTRTDRLPFTPTKTARSGLYVFADGPSGPTSVSMKAAKDVSPFVERILAIGRTNVRVGATLETAVPYEEWRLTEGRTVGNAS